MASGADYGTPSKEKRGPGTPESGPWRTPCPAACAARQRFTSMPEFPARLCDQESVKSWQFKYGANFGFAARLED